MTANNAKKEVILPCEVCEARVSAVIEGKYELFLDEPDFTIRYLLLRCPSCGTPLLASQDDELERFLDSDDHNRWSEPRRMYPETRKRQLGSSVPDPIRNAFSEALASFTHAKAYTACAIMCRKVLEGVCESHKAKGRNLSEKLKDLSDRGELDKRLFEWVTTLRIVGNEAAHDVNITVSREDANDLLDFTEAVAEYLYTFKERFEDFKKRRETRPRK